MIAASIELLQQFAHMADGAGLGAISELAQRVVVGHLGVGRERCGLIGPHFCDLADRPPFANQAFSGGVSNERAMNFSSTETIVEPETTGHRRCDRCGALPRLIGKLLDTRRGCTVSIFECVCGERIWAEDRE